MNEEKALNGCGNNKTSNGKGVASADLLAEQIATFAHTGQYRRNGVTPYINHPREVASRVVTEEEKALAWLHDVIEDTTETEDSLRVAGVSEGVIVAVKLMIHPRGEPYWKYLKRVKQSSLSKIVKIADMLANLSDSPTEYQIKKYAKGLLYLLG